MDSVLTLLVLKMLLILCMIKMEGTEFSLCLCNWSCFIIQHGGVNILRLFCFNFSLYYVFLKLRQWTNIFLRVLNAFLLTMKLENDQSDVFSKIYTLYCLLVQFGKGKFCWYSLVTRKTFQILCSLYLKEKLGRNVSVDPTIIIRKDNVRWCPAYNILYRYASKESLDVHKLTTDQGMIEFDTDGVDIVIGCWCNGNDDISLLSKIIKTLYG